MLFVHPMWDHESQRIGMQRCSPLAYNIRGYGELIGFVGLVLLLILLVFSGGIARAAGISRWKLFCLPFSLGILSELMVTRAHCMVRRKGFSYDVGKRESSWLENGTVVVYRFGAEKEGASGEFRR